MLAVLLAVTSASLAFVGGGSRHETNGNIRLPNMALRNTQETDLDLGTSGLSVGDSFVVCGDVFWNVERVGVRRLRVRHPAVQAGPIRLASRRCSSTSAAATLSLPTARSPPRARGCTSPVPMGIAITGGAYHTAQAS